MMVINKYIKVFLSIFIVMGILTVQEVSAQGPSKLSTSGYSHGMLNNFRVDAVDPEHINGHYVNQFLDYYPNSRLRGHGDTIVKMADKHGINVVAYLGQIAKETTFGSATCGGQYNFGCYMWADWMGVGKIGPSSGHNQYDRDWADPVSVEQGIEIQMQLIRNNYINKGYYYYPDYLERYSPAFENDHVSFGGLMYGVAKSFGQNVNETRYKVPGGLASNVDLGKPTLKLIRGEEVSNSHLQGVYEETRIAVLEFLEHVSTEKVTDEPVTVEVYVEFADGTVKKGEVLVEVIPRKVEVKVFNTDNQTTSSYIVTEGQGVEIDLSEQEGIDAGTKYLATQSEVELINYFANKVNGLGYEVEESAIKDNILTVDVLGNTSVYLLSELSEGNYEVTVDMSAVEEMLKQSV